MKQICNNINVIKFTLDFDYILHVQDFRNLAGTLELSS